MNGHQGLLRKLGRFLGIMVTGSTLTALVLLASVPQIGKLWTVSASVAAALLVAMYDFGLFAEELEI